MDQITRISALLTAAYRPLHRNGWLITQRITTQRAISALREGIK